MIITTPREWERIKRNLESVKARSVFIMGCGECATVAHTGGEPEVMRMKLMLEQAGYQVSGWAVGDVTCHLGGTKLDMRKHSGEVDAADAVLVMSCGAGVQTVADSVGKPVFPALESAFLGSVVRHGVYEERCRTCGDCVLDTTAGICPVTSCPKGLLNGPCGGMWDGKCEVLRDKPCTHVRIRERLAAQGRGPKLVHPPKDYSAQQKPGAVNLREAAGDDAGSGRKGDKGGAR